MSRRIYISSEGHSQRKALADAYRRWLSTQNVDLFVTLNFNRGNTINGARSQFGQWLARIDRKYVGYRFYRHPSHERTFAFGIIENPKTNIHIHALVKLPQCARSLSYPAQAQSLRGSWSKLQAPGSSDVQKIDDNLPRLASYICKQLHRPGHLDDCILTSGEFHTNS